MFESQNLLIPLVVLDSFSHAKFTVWNYSVFKFYLLLLFLLFWFCLSFFFFFWIFVNAITRYYLGEQRHRGASGNSFYGRTRKPLLGFFFFWIKCRILRDSSSVVNPSLIMNAPIIGGFLIICMFWWLGCLGIFLTWWVCCCYLKIRCRGIFQKW